MSRTDELLAERHNDYGDPVKNHYRIAQLWSALLGVEVEPEQVALCMAMVKQSRLIQSPGHQDSIDDFHAYLDIYQQVIEYKMYLEMNNDTPEEYEAFKDDPTLHLPQPTDLAHIAKVVCEALNLMVDDSRHLNHPKVQHSPVSVNEAMESVDQGAAQKIADAIKAAKPAYTIERW